MNQPSSMAAKFVAPGIRPKSPPKRSDMKLNSWLLLLIAVFTLTDRFAPVMAAPPKTKADAVDVPSIGQGLCVSNVFQTNMVIQRDKPIHVWGWSDPGEEVKVAFAGAQASAKAAEDRSWKVTLPAASASSKPQQMTITGKSGRLVLDNVLIGDVWVLGGQSNMEFPLTNVENGNLEIISANFPEIRILTVPYGEGPQLKRGFARLYEWSDWSGRHFRKGDWDVCTPETVRELSAIGFVFARRVHKAANVPIGVIDASRGGTTVETWTPLAIQRQMDSAPTKAWLAKWDADVAAFDPKADLEGRVAKQRKRIEQLKNEGKPIPDDLKTEPVDLRPGPITDPNHPGSCYAGMIAPLEGLSVKGAIFHQGYNNALNELNGEDLYRDMFPQMIKAWRAAFNDKDLPFGILSLCTEGNPQTLENYCEMMHNRGIYIREAHYRTFLDLYKAGDKNIGYTSTYDLRRRWYHPQVKLPAGERIARWALATQYGFDRQVEWKPPMLVSMERMEGALLLKLDTEVSDPQDGAIMGFAVAGEDRRFQPADVAYAEKGKDDKGRVQYDRKQLILTSPLVPKPVHYRYAWGRNPLANLQAAGNKDLPFATQRSDDWRMEEVPLGVLGDIASQSNPRADSAKILQALRQQDIDRRLHEAREIIGKYGQPQKPK